MSSRPASPADLLRSSLRSVPADAHAHRDEASRLLAVARQFRHTARLSRDDNLRLPVISSLHEAARLAVTAVAASNGLRFANRPGAHAAAVDYALAARLVDRNAWAQLDQLRDLRNKANYPSDLIEPTSEELDQFTGLVDAVLARAQMIVEPNPTRTNGSGDDLTDDS